MVFAEDIRKMILKLAEERGPDNTFEPSEVARALDPKNWKMLIDQVKLVALILIREGEIVESDINRSRKADRGMQLRKKIG